MKSRKKQAAPTAVPNPCPCGSGRAYAGCCQPYHQGQPAATAEALMRSRYSAYVLELEAYLLASWHPSTRPESLDLAAEPRPKWQGLEIHSPAACPSGSGPDDDQAHVEFVARYRVQGKAERLHEISRFVREGGHWFYVDGTFVAR